MLVIPGQSWDTGPGISSVSYEHANSVFLCDARTARPPPPRAGVLLRHLRRQHELTQFEGWGHAEIGIARSTDLVHWQVPGDLTTDD